MEKVYRWIAKHQVASRILNAIIWGCLGGYLIRLGMTNWVGLLLACLMLSVCSIYLANTDLLLQKKPLEHLKDQCDPYPFLEEMQTQQSYPGSDIAKQLRTINYAMALRCVGHYDQAYTLLRGINIDKNAGMLPSAKVTYYNNLMDLCELMGKYQEAVIWYEKTAQIFNDMRPGKQKEQLRRAIEVNRATYHFCNGEYELALRCLGQDKPKNLSERIENAMMYGRTYLAMGETERAKKPLQFVAENGNKLYCATEARELLAKINMEENE